MLGSVAIAARCIDDYAAVVGEAPIAELRRLAAPLKGLRLLALSISAFGTWQSELLSASIPLMQDLGLKPEWRIVRTDHEFEPVVRSLYEALGGLRGHWAPDQRREWERYSALNASLLDSRHDLIIIHDPQLLGLIPERGGRSAPAAAHWVWRSHLDLSSAEPSAWEMLRPYAQRYDTAIFEDSDFAPPGWTEPMAQIVRPGIDPLNPRNAALQPDTVAMLGRQHGIDPDRPLIAQISPFDEGSDALGLIEVFDALLPRFPDLQLAIVPTSIRDDERTRSYFDRVAVLAATRPSCIVLSQVNDAGNLTINAIQTLATIVVQKSLRKGFALWLSEAMWKQRPIIAGRTAGTTAQVRDGETGFLVPDTETFIERAAELLANSARRREMGMNARAHVAGHYLITRYLSDALRVLTGVVGVSETR
jgi:trehalose synthase